MPSSLESHQIVTYTQGEQLGLLHRLRVRADDGAGDDVLSLLTGFRARDDLFASVASQIDELHRLLAPPAPEGEPGSPGFLSRLRRPVSLVDRVTVTLIVVSVVAAGVALFNTLWQVEHDTLQDVGRRRCRAAAMASHRAGGGGDLCDRGGVAIQHARRHAQVGQPWRVARLTGRLGDLVVGTGNRRPPTRGACVLRLGDIKLRLGMTGSGLSLALEVLAGVLLALSAHSRNPI